MADIYLLAVLLIIAVILLFYLVFSAMIKQKKLAGIKSDFANNITHELKTPLSSVSLILQTLNKKEVKANPLLTAELLATLNRQHLKILQTVDFVLESAMEADLTVQKEHIEITSYLNEFVSDIKIQGHTLRPEIDSLKQQVLTNIQLMDKILNNLIENAAKYSPEDSVITLKAFRSHNEYHIEISDQGTGVSDRDKKYIFDKFYRIPEQNKHTVKGLGLGLYLSKRAASMLGGELELKSSTATGSVFVLKLPL